MSRFRSIYSITIIVFINLSINYLQVPSCILVGSVFGLTAAFLYIKCCQPHQWLPVSKFQFWLYYNFYTENSSADDFILRIMGRMTDCSQHWNTPYHYCDFNPSSQKQHSHAFAPVCLKAKSFPLVPWQLQLGWRLLSCLCLTWHCRPGPCQLIHVSSQLSFQSRRVLNVSDVPWAPQDKDWVAPSVHWAFFF